MDSQLLFKQVATTKGIKHACPYLDSSELISHANSTSTQFPIAETNQQILSKKIPKGKMIPSITYQEEKMTPFFCRNTPTNSLNIEIAKMKNDMKQSISSGHNIRQE
jgi:hypothetical protein